MLDYDEKRGIYALIIQGVRVEFTDLKLMIDFAKKYYNLDLYEQLN